MALASPSKRLIVATVVEVALGVTAFVVLALPLGPNQTPTGRVILAGSVMGLGILVGWIGAIWTRAARPVVPAPEGLDCVRKNFIGRRRKAFAILFGASATIAAPFVPSLSALGGPHRYSGSLLAGWAA